MDGATPTTSGRAGSAKLENSLPQLLGKTIAAIVLMRGSRAPHNQWHLVFTDGSTYELYSNSDIEGGSSLGSHTVSALEKRGLRNRRDIAVFPGRRSD